MDITQILRVRQAIEQGTYLTNAKIEAAVDAILDELTLEDLSPNPSIIDELHHLLGEQECEDY